MRAVHLAVWSMVWTLGSVAPAAAAQGIPPGTWKGKLKLASGPELAVEYTVRAEGDSLAVTMQRTGGPATPVTELRLAEREMRFVWGAFSCALTQKKGNDYEGPCQTADGTTGQLALTAPGKAEPARRAQRDILTEDDLAKTGALNVYDAVARVRSDWLRPRQQATIQNQIQVNVYMDGQLMGGVDFLRSLQVETVKEVQFLSAADATTRWGINNMGGAIVVTRR